MSFRKPRAGDFYFLIPLLALLLGWEMLSRMEVINPILLSRPSAVAVQLYHLFVMETASGDSVLLTHMYASFYRLFIACLLGGAAGILFGMLMGANEHIHAYFEPLLTVLMPIPPIAWAPIFLLWFGFGDKTLIPAGAIAAFFPIAYNTLNGVKSIDKEFIWAAESMGAGKKQVLLKVCLPWTASYIFTGFKLGLAKSWRSIIAVEMIAASLWGLGFMIFDARDFLRPSVIYGGIIMIALIYYLFENLIIRGIEKMTVEKWGMIRVGGI